MVSDTPEKLKISHSSLLHTGISDHSLVYAIRKTGIFKKANDFVEIRNMKNLNEKNVDELLNQMWEIWKRFRSSKQGRSINTQ